MDFEVTQLSFIKNELIHNHYYNNRYGNVDSIFVKNTSLQNVLNHIYGINNQKIKYDCFVNFTLKSKNKQGITKEEILMELKKEFQISSNSNNQEYHE